MTKNFSRYQFSSDFPELAEIQLNSYKWFIDQGLRELFDEVSPVRDWSGEELELYFRDYYFEEPKFSEVESRIRGASYEAPLRCLLNLINKKTKQTREQEVYLGDFPLMTDRGTFIINGVERVVVSQLIRSPGIFFTVSYLRGERQFFGAKVIPNRGAWLEFEVDGDGVISVKIDRKRKIAATSLLRRLAWKAKKKSRRPLRMLTPTKN